MVIKLTWYSLLVSMFAAAVMAEEPVPLPPVEPEPPAVVLASYAAPLPADSPNFDDDSYVASAACTAPVDEPFGDYARHRRRFANEVWGFAGIRGIYAGERMAPNGIPYDPVFALDLDLNIGLIPDKKLYVYGLSNFWGQRGSPGQSHGSYDFTKREFDLNLGLAWNYFGSFELRGFGYANNNLNRGTSPVFPGGFIDGYGFENRYYFATNDRYDVGRLSFASLGYLPGKSLRGADGADFAPGFFARLYKTFDLPRRRAYLYGDGQLNCAGSFRARLLFFDAGLAVRPFSQSPRCEFRFGATDTSDVVAGPNRGVGYVALRLVF